MKNFIYLLLLSALLYNCEAETIIDPFPKDLDDSTKSTLIIDHGSVAVDGCGWKAEIDNNEYSFFELPEILQVDSIYLFAPVQQRTDSFVCFGGNKTPYVELKTPLPTDVSVMYFKEVQCGDPFSWGFEFHSLSDGAIADTLNALFVHSSIDAIALNIHHSIDDHGYCESCACGTGRTFIILVDDQYIDQFKTLGFTEMTTCTYLDPVDQIDWLEDLVIEYEQNSQPSRITQYEYKGACVFQVDHCYMCPDAGSVVYNAEKEVVCEFGGFIGNNTCPDFSNEATNAIELYNK
ncbi:MAG: hypothetical protein OCD76_04155 [Reichenbachiella sp.]